MACPYSLFPAPLQNYFVVWRENNGAHLYKQLKQKKMIIKLKQKEAEKLISKYGWEKIPVGCFIWKAGKKHYAKYKWTADLPQLDIRFKKWMNWTQVQKLNTIYNKTT